MLCLSRPVCLSLKVASEYFYFCDEMHSVMFLHIQSKRKDARK